MLRERLIAYRKENRFTQTELANQIHVSRQTISHWETGQSTPDIQSLIFLCDLYNRIIRRQTGCHAGKSNFKTESATDIGYRRNDHGHLCLPFSSRWLLFTYAMMLTTAFSTIGVMFCLTLIKITKPFRLSTCQALTHYLMTGQIPVGRRPKISGWQLLLLTGVGICLGLILTLLLGITYLGWAI